ncbi:MAG: GNAT family N-acetyltransferase [Balneola sp.]
MNITIRESKANDLDLLLTIEKSSFEPFQQSSRRSLQLSLNSPFQKVFFAEILHHKKKVAAGSAIIHRYKHTLRIFSISILPEYQSNGIGSLLLKHIEHVALSEGYDRISLEADAENRKLIAWYNNRGYHSKELIKDYYEEGRDALRMTFELHEYSEAVKATNIIVTDTPKNVPFSIENATMVSAKEYTSKVDYFARKNLRVFNLCTSYAYQSIGYYVSLLASAREHRAFPTVTTIRDMNDASIIMSVTDDINESIQYAFRKIPENKMTLDIFFGQVADSSFQIIAQKLYHLFEAPLMRVHFHKRSHWYVKKLIPLRIDRIPIDQREQVEAFAQRYFKTQRFYRRRLKPYKYDLAILVNRDEKQPPSNKKALKIFKEVAEKLDFYTEFIGKDDLNRISEFDALFIRETTDVNGYTYQFSRKAYAEGLVVIDDPWSILRCSNKIYLNERLRLNKINTPDTRVFFKSKLDRKELDSVQLPMILKQPDSAFSKGVIKVNTKEELDYQLRALFKTSDLIIGQAFLPSEFDWRIGVLDNSPLFACKYFMAKGHWQIYDWKSKEKDPSGDFETVLLSEVPRKVLETALKAASLMGDGLYGVDLKEINGKVFVIEVNDNPNIDAGIEDKMMGKELYARIMESFINRIEMSRNLARFVSVDPD